MKNSTYDRLSQVNQVVLPGLGSLYFIVATAFDLPGAEVIIGALVIFMTCLGIFLELRSRRYKLTAEHDGEIIITITPEGKKIFTLELDKDPSEIENLKSISFKVTGEQIVGKKDL